MKGFVCACEVCGVSLPGNEQGEGVGEEHRGLNEVRSSETTIRQVLNNNTRKHSRSRA